MDIIDNFDAAIEQFLNHRINALLIEIDSKKKVVDLKQTIDNLLYQSNLILNKNANDDFVEDLYDLVFEYQHHILKHVYLIAFCDGLKFNNTNN